MMRALDVRRASAIIERVDTADGVLCPLSAVDGDLAVGATVAFDLTMPTNGRHLAKK
jgi:hypothetical protein